MVRYLYLRYFLSPCCWCWTGNNRLWLDFYPVAEVEIDYLALVFRVASIHSGDVYHDMNRYPRRKPFHLRRHSLLFLDLNNHSVELLARAAWLSAVGVHYTVFGGILHGTITCLMNFDFSCSFLYFISSLLLRSDLCLLIVRVPSNDEFGTWFPHCSYQSSDVRHASESIVAAS